MATFTGTGGDDSAHANFGTISGFTGGTVAQLQDAVGDTFLGQSGDDSVIAGNGNDEFFGGTGADVGRGQDGDDIYHFRPGHIVPGEIVDGGNGQNEVIFEKLPADGVLIQGKSATFIGISSLTFGIAGAGSLIAEFFAGQYTGGQFAANLAVSCGVNDDVLWQIEMAPSTSFNMSGFVFSADWGTGQKIEIIGDADAETIIGSSEADLIASFGGGDDLTGGGGADTLDGGTGADTMEGGQGNDLYFVDNVSDEVVELATSGSGKDTVQAKVSYLLAANVEVGILDPSGGSNLTGNSLDNTLIGNGNGNVIAGLIGDDSLDGKTGADTLHGGSGDDTLIGGSFDDDLHGGSSDDLIVGGAGADDMTGDTGNDVFDIDDTGDQIFEDASGGASDLARSSTMSLNLNSHANVENATLLGFLVLSATGSGGDNVLRGNNAENTLSGLGGDDSIVGGNGADTMAGGIGADTMEGGLGNDVYLVDSASDSVIEASGSGSGKDTVRTEATIAALAANVEVAVALGALTINIAGNASNNTISGNSAANTLTGLAGTDALSSGGGHDKLQGGDGEDTLNGGNGSDQFIYGALAECGDEIEDFTNLGGGNNDLFKFRGTAFGGLADGPIAANQFEANANGAATAATTRFIYETDTAILRFDSNGNAAGGVTVVATLQAGAVVTLGDINIF